MPIKKISFPPWEFKSINVCLEGVKTSKNRSSSLAIQQEFRDHMYKHLDSNYCYTDGSKMQDKVGYAAILSFKKIKRALPKEANIFTAELMAIKDALDEIEQQEDNSWTIYSDSAVSLLAIKRYNPIHPNVQSIQEILHRIPQNKTIALYFVKSLAT